MLRKCSSSFYLRKLRKCINVGCQPLLARRVRKHHSMVQLLDEAVGSWGPFYGSWHLKLARATLNRNLQAMADYAELIMEIKDEYDAGDSAVIGR